MKSSSKEYKYEIWENPDRKGLDGRFYVKYRPRSNLQFFSDMMIWRTLVYLDEGGVVYFDSLEAALKEVEEQIKHDDYVPEKHVKRWP